MAVADGIVANVLFALALISYFRTMFTDPGGVPPDSSSLRVTEFEYGTQNPRQCAKCRNIKPDRAHHCSTCGACVLKMDHHCPWVNNCVGFRNFKFFTLFLLYTGFAAISFLSTSIPYLIFTLGSLGNPNGWKYLSDSREWELIIQVGVQSFLSFCWGFGLFAFAMVNFTHAKDNTTTLQSLIGKDNKYDIGTQLNFQSTFGEHALLWFLPVLTIVGDGVHFPLRIDPNETQSIHNNKNYNSFDKTPLSKPSDV
jgi:palmitoyltransferase